MKPDPYDRPVTIRDLDCMASAAAVADGELLGHYREWRALKSDLDGETMSMDSALWKSGEKRLWEIEDMIMNARAGTVHGLAVKIVVANGLDFWGDPQQKLLTENALAILGDRPV
ncbi:hypothetical protein QKW60_08250 [Defluviimonas aestuarii]|uniref:hypothetical protein n=1 Tax=Albidovulum aestuarii TaxID=1130726 RepID=UPI00249C6B81|nr:hypothetical protein [Defluviimonas aestuarii]MDI3336393.1 hypothetical protein [Defluviimonas aestuarii]